ncbi:MAG: hypothetical protein V7K50_03270 [Nostoc sp.]|uniref:hypothetical protein n=1 Tax=Nostoc sp. TaxID=1180 RepID=UPI002FF587E6
MSASVITVETHEDLGDKFIIQWTLLICLLGVASEYLAINLSLTILEWVKSNNSGTIFIVIQHQDIAHTGAIALKYWIESLLSIV